MRVGLVCPYDLGAIGGVQAQVLGLAGALRQLGHEVEVLAPGTDPPPGTTSTGRSIRFRVNGSVAPMAPHPAAAWRSVQAARRGGFDVLHLHEPLAPSITIPILLAHPAPVVGTFHAAGDRTPYRWAERPLRRLAARIDQRVAVSEPAAALARRHLGGSYEVLPNGIDPRPFADPSAVTPRPPSVLFLGRHEPRKGLDVLLDAVALLPDDVIVWIGGHGPETPRLRQRSADERRVRWLGQLTETEKVRRLAGASVLCAPSTEGESFGVVLLEAMAAGTPIVASDLPGYRSSVGESSAAVLVPPGDSVALAHGLREVLCDPQLAGRLRAAGRALAAGLAFEALARRYLDLYERARSA